MPHAGGLTRIGGVKLFSYYPFKFKLKLFFLIVPSKDAIITAFSEKTVRALLNRKETTNFFGLRLFAMGIDGNQIIREN